MKATVIIPAYNEENVMRDCLESLVQQTEQDFKAIIVDDQSTDNTAAIIRSYAEHYPEKIELRQYGKVGPGRARNLVAKEATTDFLLFMDADCIATPHWVEEILKGFDRENTASSGGPHIAPKGSNPFQISLDRFFERMSPIISFYKGGRKGSKISETDHNPLCNVAYKRSVFLELEGFREDLFPGEDYEFDYRIKKKKYRITYNPKALVYHHRPENIQAFKKVMFAYGRAQGKLVREKGPHRLIHYAPIILFGIILDILLAGYLFEWLLGSIVAVAILLRIVFRFRPPTNNSIGIFFNAFEWFNGFFKGFITKKSPAPGSAPIIEEVKK